MKQVILVRKDLNMSPGKAAAQCCHASLGAFICTQKRHLPHVNQWLEEGQTKIILMVEDEVQLLKIHEEVSKDKDLKYRLALIRDAGHTELKGQNLTTLGVGPCNEEIIDKYTNTLKLYK